MKKKQEKTNHILMRVFDGDKPLTCIELQSYHLIKMGKYITDVGENYSGGLTIWLDVQLETYLKKDLAD